MACFDLRKSDAMIVEEEGDRVGEVLSCFGFLKRAMTADFSTGMAAWKPKVGVAGSAALCLVERLMAQAGDGKRRGRWSGVSQADGIWNPNDVDVFVCGRSGSRRASFRVVVRWICGNMMKDAARAGRKLMVEEEREMRYTGRPEAFLIQNVKMEGMETAVSFIQVPECRDVSEVTEQFDMDIAKCMMNIEKEQLCVPVEVASHIWEGKADVTRDFVTCLSYPTEVEERIICSTLSRMRKYGKRGYRFNRYSRVMSREEHRAATSRGEQEAGERGDDP